jgi:hypothetical protein
MFFDRLAPITNAVADAVRERGSTSLVEAVVQSLDTDFLPGRGETLDEASQLHWARRSYDVATGSPTLVAARLAERARLIDEVSIALAQRVGADPVDPDVRLAAFVIAGIVEVLIQSIIRQLANATSAAALNDGVHRAILKAAQLAEPSLTAFDNLRVMADG